MTYRIMIKDRRYNEYTVNDATIIDHVHEVKINPRKERLFIFDIFDVNKDNGKCTIKHSPIRNQKQISGIMQLSGKTVFGKEGKKMLYKCVPDDKRLPFFIAPFKMPTSAFCRDKYVIFKFKQWDEGAMYPKASIVHTIGDVSRLENYYEYQLYCNSLYTSIKNFNNDTIRKLHNTNVEDIVSAIDAAYPRMEDRTNMDIFTIDPSVSKDFDDALGIQELENGNVILSVYITNVVLWLNHLKLWNSFSQRVSTIYLPDRKRPMLPTILSDNICSLKEKETRYAFCLDITVDSKNTIINTNYVNVKLKINKNYCYEEESLLKKDNYQNMLNVVQKMNMIKSQNFCEVITDSHELVSYMMILMNYYCSQELMANKNGIFRSLKFKENDYNIPEELSPEIRRFIRIWSSNGSKYILYDENEDKRHDMFKFKEYVHITSPIRRLVDLLNIMQIQINFGLIEKNNDVAMFLEKWINVDAIKYINDTMRSIRKVQNSCALMHKCTTDKDVLTTQYTGCIVDKMERNDKSFQYIVYINNLGFVGKMICFDDYAMYSVQTYKLFYFQDGDTLKKKIRISCV